MKLGVPVMRHGNAFFVSGFSVVQKIRARHGSGKSAASSVKKKLCGFVWFREGFLFGIASDASACFIAPRARQGVNESFALRDFALSGFPKLRSRCSLRMGLSM